jgi:hypothetical protein
VTPRVASHLSKGLPQKKPLAGSGVPLITHQPFDHAEMVAKDVRDVGVRFTKANDDLEQFADRAAGAAGGSRQAQRAQPSAPDEINRLKRQNTFPLAFAFALSDLGEQVFSSLGERRSTWLDGARLVADRGLFIF